MTHRSRAHTRYFSVNRRRLIVLLVGLLALYAILPSLGDFHTSWHLWGQARPALVAWALVGFVGTYVCAAAMYQVLAPRRLHFGRTLLMQVAAGFAGKLLPAGIGALGVNYEYLRRERFGQLQAGMLVALNNTLGFVGNLLLVAGLWVCGAIELPHRHLHITTGWWLVAGLVLLVILVLLWRYQRAKGPRPIHLRHALSVYRRTPWRLPLALAVSIGLTALYATILWLCCRALGLSMGWPQAVVVLSLGVTAGTAVPTPGGLGAAEAGLVGSLVLYDQPAAAALAAVLLYRLITYWLGLAGGGAAFWLVVRRGYVGGIS